MNKDTIPSLGEFFEFEEKEDEYDIGKSAKTENMKDQEPKFINKNSDLDNPTDEQIKEVQQIIAEYKNTPEMKAYYKKIILEALLFCKEIKDYQNFVNIHIVKILSLEDTELVKIIKEKENEIGAKKLEEAEKERNENKEK